MAVEVKLPRLGQGMEAGTIVRWLKSEGENVVKGDPLYELDTDKVTQEVEAEADGVLLKIVVSDGEVDVGTTVGVIGAEGEEVSLEPPEPQPAEPSEPKETPAEEAARPAAEGERKEPAEPSDRSSQGRAVEREPSAPRGAPAAAEARGRMNELNSIRRTIARRLTEAWEAPVFQLTVTADASELVATREQTLALVAEGDVKPTVNDVLTRVVAAALVQHRAVNAHFVEGQIRRHSAAHVGIAVATPNGLVVPVIRDADRKTVREIASARADLVTRAREGKLQLQDLEDGTFTISNLGMYGIEQFVAVLNPPQVAILAVGAIADRSLVVDGELEVAPTMTMTLTCDHRAIDGSEGAEFLRTVKAFVEAPALAL